MRVCQVNIEGFGKPWWNEDLSVVWNKVCLKEKLWIKCKEPRQKQNNILKLDYKQKRKQFDRHVQRAKI